MRRRTLLQGLVALAGGAAGTGAPPSTMYLFRLGTAGVTIAPAGHVVIRGLRQAITIGVMP